MIFLFFFKISDFFQFSDFFSNFGFFEEFTKFSEFFKFSEKTYTWPLEGQPGQKIHRGGTWSSDFSKGFSKGNVSEFSKFEHFEKFPLENPLEKSDDHVPPLWFFWPGWPSSGQFRSNSWMKGLQCPAHVWKLRDAGSKQIRYSSPELDGVARIYGKNLGVPKGSRG